MHSLCSLPRRATPQQPAYQQAPTAASQVVIVAEHEGYGGGKGGGQGGGRGGGKGGKKRKIRAYVLAPPQFPTQPLEHSVIRGTISVYTCDDPCPVKG